MKKFAIISMAAILIITFIVVYNTNKKSSNTDSEITVYFNDKTFEVSSLDDKKLNTFIEGEKSSIESKINETYTLKTIEINHEFVEEEKNKYKLIFNGEATIEDIVIINEDLEISEYKFIKGNSEKITFNYTNTVEYDLSDYTHFEIGAVNNDTTLPEFNLASNPSSITAVVNKNRRLSDDYVPSNLTAITVSSQHSGENNQVRADILPYLEEMFSDAKSQNFSLTVTSAYRSYAYQNTLFNNYVAQHGYDSATTFSAFPGASEHQTGLVVDIGNLNDMSKNFSSEFGNTDEGKWLAANAHKYGFILRYPEGETDITGYIYEPWHFRYVGVELATYIYENDLTLEEFFNIQ